MTTRSLAGTCLFLLSVAAISSAQNNQSPLSSGKAAADIPRVNRNLCKSQFNYRNIAFSGCITIDSIGNEPWCPLNSPPAGGLPFAFCIKETIPPREARPLTRDANAATVPCDESTPIPNLGVVYGCFTTQIPGGQLSCNSGSLGRLPCMLMTTPPAGAVTGPAAGNTSETAKPSNSSSDATDPNSATSEALSSKDTQKILGLPILTAGLILGGVALLVIAILIFFCCRKKGKPAKAPVKPPAKIDPAYGYNEAPQVGTPTATFATAPTAATRANAPQKPQRRSSGYGPRASSQYGPNSNSRMSMISINGGANAVQPDLDSPTQILGKFVVESTYSPTLNDEISISPGDIVEVYQEFDDGWCSAVNLSAGNARGVFPLHCIDKSKPLPN